MQNAERLTIMLTSDLAEYVRAKVQTGEYLSSSDLIRDALHSWQDQERLWAERVQHIRARIADADADPRPSLTDAEVEAHFAARRQQTLEATGKRD